ncbi:MAG: T9SS type A sorting domain-containing protein [Bacteroidales bacterium]
MKEIYSLIITFLLFNPVTGQEIQNSDFENWVIEGEYEIPEGFETSNEASAQWENTLTLEKTDIVHSGNWAVKLTAKNLLLDFVSPGFLTTGRFEFDLFSQNAELFGGTYFPYRPEKISGYYKYTPANSTDKCLVGALLLKYNGSEISDTVGIAEFYGTDTVSEYTFFETDFQYNSTETPDSLQLTVLSTDFEAPVPESQMFIDDISIEMPTGQIINLFGEAMAVYPNPSSGTIHIKTRSNAHINIFSMDGKLIKSSQTKSTLHHLDLSALPKAAYILNIITKDNDESRIIYLH